MKRFWTLVMVTVIGLFAFGGCTPNETVEEEKEEPVMLEPSDAIMNLLISNARDPYVLHHDGKYYIYTTGWNCYVSQGDELSVMGWKVQRDIVQLPEDFAGDNWAPEVHYYDGAFYMFTTYRSTKNDHRGCAIFRSESPTGPFVLHTDGHNTPSDWDAIDGTLYVDEEGQPWMVFVHEWTSTDDGIGRMDCVKLSKDLKTTISEPVELFRADDPSWGIGNPVTDGCFLYKTEGGQLLMLWSTWDARGYCVGIVRSESGSILGPWTHDEERLFSKSILGDFDGGHGMIFSDSNEKLWLSIHSPNNADGMRPTIPVLIPIKEENNTLVWDLESRPENTEMKPA